MKKSFPLRISTEDGDFAALYSESGLAELRFPGGAAECDRSVPDWVQEWHERTAEAVEAILDGKAPGELPPLDLNGHSEFQRRVWAELRKIGPGETVSYGQLAANVGIPAGARAVGNACGANPMPLIIPCHRVLAAGRGLGGFSGGLDWKRRLLRREGSAFLDREVAGGVRPRCVQRELAQFLSEN